MGLLSDPSQHDFFKKRWQHRVWRVKKKFIPVFFSALFVFVLILTCTQLFHLEFSHQNGQTLIMAHTFLSVLLGVAVIVLGDCLHLRRKSHFLPIRIKIPRRGQHE